MNFQEAQSNWGTDRDQYEALGAVFPDAQRYITDAEKRDYRIAMDAQPQLLTTPNSAIPVMFTTMVDPTVFEVLFSPTTAAKILGEQKKGDWTDQTIMFPMIEHAGEVSSYGDFSTNGKVTANSNFPQRQSYLYQTILEYGDLELDRAGRAKLNWLAQLQASAATVMNRFQNFTYFFGVAGLQNYGMLNDPSLLAPITPAMKAYGGVQWINANGTPVATANEVYADIQAIYYNLVNQNQGLVDADSEIVLVTSPQTAVAFKTTNSFGVNVYALLKENFPKIRFETGVQYGGLTAANPQGVAGGNFVQMWVTSIEGQQTGFAAFNEKMRAHRLIADLSSYKQKMTGGTWGAVIRMPIAAASMIGV